MQFFLKSDKTITTNKNVKIHLLLKKNYYIIVAFYTFTTFTFALKNIKLKE